MPTSSQSYANHRRYFPLYHYIALPIVTVNVLVILAELLRLPTLRQAWLLVFAVGVAAGFVACRASILTVQDRLIGLEMRLRLAAVLPPALRMRIPELRIRQLVALRFAGDSELPLLVQRCLDGELRTPDDVKRQIREWRPDFVRA
jgi:4-amino-4-deoxy-L-arabinose transferase-like glycosyltransferase